MPSKNATPKGLPKWTGRASCRLGNPVGVHDDGRFITQGALADSRPLYVRSKQESKGANEMARTENALAGGRPAKRRRASARRSGAGRPPAAKSAPEKAALNQTQRSASCEALVVRDTNNLNRAFSGTGSTRNKRLAVDRATLGGLHSAAQRDRGQPHELNPNSRSHRARPRASSSPHAQGRD